jgi:hypothetical protein
MEILDPTDERTPVARELSPRPAHLRNIALLDINKMRGNILLDQIEKRLSEALPETKITRYRKPTFARPAPLELKREIMGGADFVIEALAD